MADVYVPIPQIPMVLAPQCLHTCWLYCVTSTSPCSDSKWSIMKKVKCRNWLMQFGETVNRFFNFILKLYLRHTFSHCLIIHHAWMQQTLYKEITARYGGIAMSNAKFSQFKRHEHFSRDLILKENFIPQQYFDE